MLNYKELDLSLGEKIYFCLLILMIGLIVGWIFYDSLVIGCVITLLLYPLEKEYRRYLNIKREQELLLQFKDFLYSVSSSVSSGRSIGQGIRESYSFWKGTYADDDYIMIELKMFIEKMEKSNAEDVYLLEDFAMRSGLKDIEDMAMICRVCKRTGANIAKALQEASNIIGDKIALERELRSIMIQKRFEGYVIAIAPLLLTVMSKIMSPGYLAPLTESNTGRLISTMSLCLIVIAWLYLERINRIEI